MSRWRMEPDADATTEIITHQIDILRVGAGLRADAIEELEKLEAAITQKLTSKADLSINKAAKLEALLEQTSGQIADAYGKIEKDHADGLKQLAKLEGKQAVKVVNAQIGVPVVTTAIAPKLLEATVDGDHIFGHSSKAWWSAQEEDLRFKFAGAMKQGILLGESVDELARRLTGTKAAGYTDGIMGNKKREAEALVRSSVNAISNEARMRAFEEMGDIVKGIQWVATLDSRTTPICRALDGKMWTLKDKQPIGHDKKYPGPTAHWNCRSTQITVLKSWDELSGKKLPSINDDELQAAMEEELEAAGWKPDKIAQAKVNTRASMNGQVPKTDTFQEWIATKSDATIDRILGPGRAALWKAGKLTVSDMTNQDNRPLTLKQLAEKIATGIPAPETLGVAWPKQEKAAPFEDPDPEPVPAKELPALTAVSLAGKKVRMKAATQLDTESSDEFKTTSNYGEMNAAILSQGGVIVMKDAAGAIKAAVGYHFDEGAGGKSELAVDNVGSAIKGGGTAVMKQIAALAAAKKADIVFWSVPASVGFYQKLGFTQVEGGAPGLMKMTAEQAKKLAQPNEPTPATLGTTAPAPAPSAADSKASAELATQAQSKTWSALAAKVIADNPSASPETQLAIFNEKKLQKQQATMLNDTAAANVAKGWTPPVTKTLLNKLADDDPAKLAFLDKVKLAKAKLDADQAEADAQKQLADFTVTSKEHETIASNAYVSGMTYSQHLAAAHAAMNAAANAKLHALAATEPDPPPPAFPLGLPELSPSKAKGIVKKLTDVDEFDPDLDGFTDGEIAKMKTSPLMNVDLGGPDHEAALMTIPSAQAVPGLLKDYGSTQTVKIKDLIVSQTWLDVDKAEAALKTQYDPAIGKPLVIKKDGKLILADGNHRTWAEKEKGAKDILVDVIDLDAPVKKPDVPPPPATVVPATGTPGQKAAKALKAKPDAGAAELAQIAAKELPKPTATPEEAKAIADITAAGGIHGLVLDNYLKGGKTPAEAIKAAADFVEKNALDTLKAYEANTSDPVQKQLAGGALAVVKAKHTTAVAALDAFKKQSEAAAAEASKAPITSPATLTSTVVETHTVYKNAVKAGASGKKLTKVQQSLINSLSDEQKLKFAQNVKEAAGNPAAMANAAATTGPDTAMKNLAPEPPDLANLTMIKTLPGSTGPTLQQDETTGKQWVVKNTTSTSKAHVENETLADAIYRAAGARVPFSTIVLDNDGTTPYKVAEFIPDGKQLAQALTPATRAQAQQHFVLDALLGNWDAVGTGKNNMLVDPAGNLWRIDNGGALAYRAMGTPKDAKWMTPEVQELASLRNASINPDAAEVYKGITTDEINRQIGEILDRKEAILSAAASDPKTRDLLEARIGYLETLLPAAAKRIAPAPTTAAIPANIAKTVPKAKGAGITLLIGGKDVEDNQAVVWQERQGTDTVLRAQLKLTPAGSAVLRKHLLDAGTIMPAPASASGPMKPPTVASAYAADWQKMQTMLKHVGTHAMAGTVNPMKVADLAPLQAKYAALMKTGSGEVKAMADHYDSVLYTIANAIKNKEKPEPAPNQLWTDWDTHKAKNPTLLKYFPDPKPPVAAPSAAPVPASGKGPLANWQIQRLDQWDSKITVAGPDGIRVRTATDNHVLDMGEGYEMTKGSVRIRFAPTDAPLQDRAGEDTDKAMHGTVQIWVNDKAVDSASAQALAALQELGLNTAPPTDAHKELVYLHKGFYLTKKHTLASYTKVYDDPTLSDEEKVEKIRKIAEKTFGVKLPKDRSGWGPNYNPDGRNDASDGTGYMVWDRWDIPPAQMEKELAGYTLQHATSKMLGAVQGFLAMGRVTSTYDRMRTGILVAPGEGKSAIRDLETGGAVHFYTSVQPATATRAAIRFKIRNLGRLDILSRHADSFGRSTEYHLRKSAPEEFKQAAGRDGWDSGLMKNGVSFVDELDTIITGSQKLRDDIIDEFKKAGYAVLPDGRKIEDVVRA